MKITFGNSLYMESIIEVFGGGRVHGDDTVRSEVSPTEVLVIGDLEVGFCCR